MTKNESKSRVLVVEDDADIRDGIRWVLESKGLTVDFASHGGEALEYLHNAPPPAMILLDLVMPVMDGWAFRRELAQDPALAGIPLVIVSGSNNREDVVPGVRVVGHLEKPLSLEGLLATVAKVIQR